MYTVRQTVTNRHFLVHYLQMLIAMALGMVALGPLWPAIHSTELMTLTMATDMAVAMAAWMAFRRHSWRSIAEMTAAMFLPFIALFPAYSAGAISSGLLMVLGHVLMLFAMAAAMLLRPGEYLHTATESPAS